MEVLHYFSFLRQELLSALKRLIKKKYEIQLFWIKFGLTRGGNNLTYKLFHLLLFIEIFAIKKV